MRFYPYLFIAPTAAVALAQVVHPLHRVASDIQQQRQPQPADHAQIPLIKATGGLGSAMTPPGAPSADSPANVGGGGSVMLSDVMGRDKSINLFAGCVAFCVLAALFVRGLADMSNTTASLGTSNHHRNVWTILLGILLYSRLSTRPWKAFPGSHGKIRKTTTP